MENSQEMAFNIFLDSFKKNLTIEVDMNSILVDIYKEDKIIYYKYQIREIFLEDEILKKFEEDLV